MYKLTLFPLLMLCLIVAGCQQQTGDVDAVQQMANDVLDRYQAIWNTGSWETLNATIDSTYIAHRVVEPYEVVGREGFKAMIERHRTTFPDFTLTTDEFIVKGNDITVRWTVRGTQLGPLGDLPPTGKTMTISGISLLRIANGKVVEVYDYWDHMSVLQQLGFTLTAPTG